MRIVIALGGNALLQRGQRPDLPAQRANVEIAAVSIAEVAGAHEVVVTHGNGPQVGLLALQAEAYDAVPAYPLDVLDAQTEGMIGYLIEQALRRQLPEREIATLLTQVEVGANDPAFRAPSKPIGSVYAEADSRRLSEERGWVMARDGDGFRRVVASPEPRRLVEIVTIGRLVDAGVLVICAGGGGIPVTVEARGKLTGVDAVVDKDLTAALLAREIGAEMLLLLTDVSAVYADWPRAREPIAKATPDPLRDLELDPGSMGPKVEAACRFAEETGGVAVIGALGSAAALVEGSAGTRVTPS